MKMIKTEDAVGRVLQHDVTRIVPGEFKGRLFKKGHVIREEDIEPLLKAGKFMFMFGKTLQGLYMKMMQLKFL